MIGEATAPPRDRRTAGSAPASRSGGYVRELHGLRGLALVLVVMFHLFGAGRVSGGVDVFLVLSAFLVTRSVVGRLEENRFSLVATYANTAARLLPAASIVLLTVGLVSLVLMPIYRQGDLWKEIAASALFVENWHLIRTGLSYGAATWDTSPLQHYWSLSVQGQFLILWPALLLGIWMAARKAVRAPFPLTVAVTAVMTVISLVYAVLAVEKSQPIAYFHTGARLWELGAGALAALFLTRFSVAAKVGGPLMWAGLALVLTSGFVVDGAGAFPGPWTLWPVLGAVFVILGAGACTNGPAKLLSSGLLHRIADLGYPLYLWHWPVLIYVLLMLETTEVGWKKALAVLAVSLVLSWCTRRLVELPVGWWRIRRSHRRTLTAALLSVVAAFGGGTGAATAFDRRLADDLEAAAGSAYVGAMALHGAGVPTVPSPLPRPALAPLDRPMPDESCAQKVLGSAAYDDAITCVLYAPEDARLSVALVGGSHTEQWVPAFEILAQEHSWRLSITIKHGCRLSTEVADPPARPWCTRWSAEALRAVVAQQPDVVVLTDSWTSVEGPDVRAAASRVESWHALTDADIEVAVLRDTPRIGVQNTECGIGTGALRDACSKHRRDVYDPDLYLDNPNYSRAIPIDTADLFCSDTCPAVIGNVVVYQDGDHVTATYMRTLVQPLARLLADCAEGAHDVFGLNAAGVCTRTS